MPFLKSYFERTKTFKAIEEPLDYPKEFIEEYRASRSNQETTEDVHIESFHGIDLSQFEPPAKRIRTS